MTALELLICGALVGCSAFLSASEIAIFSLSRFQLRGLKDRFGPAHKTIRKLQADPGGVLITILVLNEIVNIALSAIVTSVLDRAFAGSGSSWWVQTLVGVLVITPIVLFLCEVTPKTIAARGNTLVAPLTAAPLFGLYSVMKPVRAVIRRIVVLASGKEEEKSPPAPLREEELMVMVEEGHREGTIQRSELDLIRNVFELEETPVRELMTPLSQVQALVEGVTINEAIEQVRRMKITRIPVLSSNRKKAVGILYLKDLLRERLNPALGGSPVASLMHKPLVVSHQLPANRLFRRLRRSKTHIALVEGAGGELLGVVTLDQILDELMEELLTEKEA